MGLRQQHAALIADYLAKGGTIRKLPPPKPITASDVLKYLQESDVDVRVVPGPDGADSHYTYKSKAITLKTLVELANRHRLKRRLPPFQVPSNMH